MQQLHLVGFTTDLESIILSARKGTKSGGFVLRLDDSLLEAVQDAVRQRAEASAETSSRARPDSALSPREIQARLRAGRGVKHVAAEAGVDEAWIARFEAPVAAERRQVIARARSLTYERPRRGESGQPLGVAVRWNLVEKGVPLADDEFDKGWNAWHVIDQTWAVTFGFTSRQHNQTARWDVDVREGELVARNRQASDLAYVEPGSRRRPLAEFPARAGTARAAIHKPPPAKKRAAATSSPRRAAKSTRTTKKAAKAAGRKTVAKKNTSRKVAAKKTPAKKAPAKKAPAKKSAKRPTAAPRRPAAPPPRPAFDSARRAPAARPEPPGLDELGRRRLELATARPGALPGSGPRRPAELRRLVGRTVPAENEALRRRRPPVEELLREEVHDATAAEVEDEQPDEAALAGERRAQRVAERRARLAARDQDETEGPPALGPGPSPAEGSPAAGGERVVTIRANRARPPDGDDDGGEIVKPPTRPLRPALAASQPRKPRRFGRTPR